VNVGVGADEPGSIERAGEVPGAHVHDYGKRGAPGASSVTSPSWATTARAAHVTAHGRAARAYGTGTRETIVQPAVGIVIGDEVS